MSTGIAGIEKVLVDDSFVLPEGLGSIEGREVFAKEAYTGLGGPVPTALAFVRSLGIKDIRYMGAVGDDQLSSKTLRDLLVWAGLDTRYLIVQPGSETGMAHVHIDDAVGTRTIVYSIGPPPIPETAIMPEFLEGIRILHIDAREPIAAKKAAILAKAQETLVSIDTGDLKPDSEELIRFADIVIAPKRFAQGLLYTDNLPDASRRLFSEYGPKQIAVVTDGENGFAYTTSEGTFTQQAFRVKTIDSNGAGDIFSGGLLYEILTDMTYEDSITFASAAAALKCTQRGKYFASKEEISQLLAQQQVERIFVSN